MEQIQTSIDLITDKLLWLLHKLFNLTIIFCNYNTILAWVLNFSYNNCSLFAMSLMELYKLIKWVFTNNIRVEDKEKTILIIFSDYLLCQFDRAGRTEWLVLERASDFDIVLFFKVFKLLLNYLCLETHSQDNLSDTSRSKCFDLMTKNWKVAKVHKWFWNCESHGTEAGSKTSY